MTNSILKSAYGIFWVTTIVLSFAVILLYYKAFILSERYTNLLHEAAEGDCSQLRSSQCITNKCYEKPLPPPPPISRIISNKDIMQMKRYGWTSPIVVDKYKLLFLPIEKNACTQWKKLFHLIQNYAIPGQEFIHNPNTNKLKYLNQMHNSEVTRILMDPSWTIATMVREPKSRLLSGFFHMKNEGHFKEKNFSDFVHHVRRNPYRDPHWEPQTRFPEWLYKHMVIGRMENMQEFGKELLIRIGAWNKYGCKWGKNGNEIIFSEQKVVWNKSNSTKLLAKFYTRALEDIVLEIFHDDFRLFNYSSSYISAA